MNDIKLFITGLLVVATVPVMAQTSKEQQNKKDDVRAKTEVVKGQSALVIMAGSIKDISLKWDASLEHKLDSLVTAPFGKAIKMKDLDGYNVDIAKANVNSNVGLMFTSGTKCVAISEEEWNKIKQ